MDCARKDLDELRVRILEKLKPSLKTPSTAELCHKSLLNVISLGGNMYLITGYVTFQTRFGRKVRRDFSARVDFVCGKWTVFSAQLDAQPPKEGLAGCVLNSIGVFFIIVIITAVAYWILTEVYGFYTIS